MRREEGREGEEIKGKEIKLKRKARHSLKHNVPLAQFPSSAPTPPNHGMLFKELKELG